VKIHLVKLTLQDWLTPLLKNESVLSENPGAYEPDSSKKAELFSQAGGQFP